MTRAEFQTQMGRLNGQWQRFYSQERMSVFWNRFQNVSGDSFRRAVDRALGECRNAPLVDDLAELVGAEIPRLTPSSVVGCGECDSGFVLETDNDGYRRIYACGCRGRVELLCPPEKEGNREKVVLKEWKVTKCS